MSRDYYDEGTVFDNVILEDDVLTDLEFSGCRFDSCALERVRLVRCRFTDCIFTGCRAAELECKDTILLDCTFESCHLTGINWSTLFGGGFMAPIEAMRHCHLKYNYFTEMNFAGFDFSQNEILSSMFADCKLAKSNFSDCALEQTEFFRCDLTEADFRKASGYQIDLETNKLKKARFSYPEVVNLLNGLGLRIE